jgi:hypothetical protein
MQAGDSNEGDMQPMASNSVSIGAEPIQKDKPGTLPTGACPT